MKRGNVLGTVGLAPFWLALGFVVFDGLSSGGSSNFWIGDPWLIVLSLPCCLVTLVIATVLPLSDKKSSKPFANGRKW